MYNDCMQVAEDVDRVIQMVQALPTLNRRVVLFVMSLMQLFLRDEVQAATVRLHATMRKSRRVEGTY